MASTCLPCALLLREVSQLLASTHDRASRASVRATCETLVHERRHGFSLRCYILYDLRLIYLRGAARARLMALQHTWDQPLEAQVARAADDHLLRRQ